MIRMSLKVGRRLFPGAWILTLTVLSLALAGPPATGDSPPERERLTLERVLGGDFSGEGYAARWLEDRAQYTRFEPAQAGHGRDLVLYDAASGDREVLVPGHHFIPSGRSSPLAIEDYTFSPDRSALLLYTNSRRVWRHHTRGDYWLLDRTSGELKQLGGDGPPSTMMFATFSPDSTRIAFVRHHNLHVQRLTDLEVTALTHDGDEHRINGTFDWVYEEELDLRQGFRWSPDGRQLAFWQIDTTGVPEFILINNTDSLYPRLTRFPYPKAGETNPAARIGIVSADGSDLRWVPIPGDPREHYLARLEWVPAPTRLLIQQLNRRQDVNQLFLVDPDTTTVTPWFAETDPAWVDVRDDPCWFAGHQRLLWLGEADGWRRAYAVSRPNGRRKPLTRPGFDVIELLAIDEPGRCFYFLASPDNAAERHLFSAPLNGGSARRLTPADQPGTHTYRLSNDARWAIHTWSRLDQPPHIELISIPDHTVHRVLIDNAPLRQRFAALEPVPLEFFQVALENGTRLDGWCLKPPDFDPHQRYPVLFHVYGEPAGQTVLDRWGGRTALWHRFLAQSGYVVISLDNRGTPAPRGREWRKCIYGQVGVLASADQAQGVRALQARWPWIDPDRIGIWGWSGGGSMTLNALFRHPDLYHVGLAVAPVPNLRLYDTIYQERYMGRPTDNVEGYRLGSPLTFASRLAGHLLLVHGTGDDNVHYQGVEQLINELVAHNKPFSLMAYPNRSHGIGEGPNTSRHLFELLTRFLETHLPAGPRQP